MRLIGGIGSTLPMQVSSINKGWEPIKYIDGKPHIDIRPMLTGVDLD
jgi:hypothetical protein